MLQLALAIEYEARWQRRMEAVKRAFPPGYADTDVNRRLFCCNII